MLFQADEKMRQSLFKLRQTWTGVFAASRLYGLDIKVSQVDPAWPITAPQQTSSHNIHVNPKFLGQASAQQVSCCFPLLYSY